MYDAGRRKRHAVAGVRRPGRLAIERVDAAGDGQVITEREAPRRGYAVAHGGCWHARRRTELIEHDGHPRNRLPGLPHDRGITRDERPPWAVANRGQSPDVALNR